MQRKQKSLKQSWTKTHLENPEEFKKRRPEFHACKWNGLLDEGKAQLFADIIKPNLKTNNHHYE